jgi:hypothetical protein
MTPHERDTFVERSKADPTDAERGGDKYFCGRALRPGRGIKNDKSAPMKPRECAGGILEGEFLPRKLVLTAPPEWRKGPIEFHL